MQPTIYDVQTEMAEAEQEAIERARLEYAEYIDKETENKDK